MGILDGTMASDKAITILLAKIVGTVCQRTVKNPKYIYLAQTSLFSFLDNVKLRTSSTKFVIHFMLHLNRGHVLHFNTCII